MDRARQPGAVHLVGRLAVRLGHVHRHASDDDARPVPQRRTARCVDGVPRRRVEPVDGVAVLPAGAVDRRAPRTAPAGLAVPGARGGLDRLAGGGAGAVAVQPRLPAEQGAVLRPGHRQRDPGAARRQGRWFLPCSSSAPRWCCAWPEAAPRSCCRRWSGRRVWRRNCCPPMRLPAARGQSNGRFVSWRRRCGRALWSGWEPCRTASISSTNRCRSCWAWGSRLPCRAMAALFTALWLPAAIALPVLAAWALHKWIEVPALRHGRAIARRSMTPAAAPVSAG